MRWVLAWSVVMIVAMAGGLRADDLASLSGKWSLASWEEDGKAVSKDRLEGAKLVLDGDRFKVTLDGQGTKTGTQKLDASKQPKTIDITEDSGPDKGKTCQGIYEVKDDEFRVAFAPPGKPRPTAFATAPDSGQWLHVWHRVKE